MILLILFSVVAQKFCFGISPSPTRSFKGDVSEIEEDLNRHISKVSENPTTRFSEEIIRQLQSSLVRIESNVKNLQERAHVWDTFQLHVSAWNDQLSTADRKLDILSKAQERVYNLDAKLNLLTNVEFKLDRLSDRMAAMEGFLQEINGKVDDKKQDQNLFGDFVVRGILSTLKQIEKKVDRIGVNGRNVNQPMGKNGKCHVDEILKDISSKVDVIFDKLSEKDEVPEQGYYNDQRSGESEETSRDVDVKLLRNVLSRLYEPCKKTGKVLEDVLARVKTIENNTYSISKEDDRVGGIRRFLTEKCDVQNKTIENILGTCRPRIHDQTIGTFENDLSTTEEVPTTKLVLTDSQIPDQFDYTYCNTVNTLSGVIRFFETNTNDIGRDYNRRVCERGWTVIQNRDDFTNQENFNRSWFAYKMGFGDLEKDFWFGNDFIHKLSVENDLKLRVELENFDGIKVWAEYDVFKVADESKSYELQIGGYSGTASDSFSSHNTSKFSTYDQKNDIAPNCCSCASSFGSGWWFNNCFESNLNGPYYKHPHTTEYYKGIIWENWLGNYSLKKTKMMVKPKGNVKSLSNLTSAQIFIEDP